MIKLPHRFLLAASLDTYSFVPLTLEMFTDQALKSLQVIDIVQILSLMMENNRPNNKRNKVHMDSVRVFCDISHKMRK
jgi:hypothetical protein